MMNRRDFIAMLTATPALAWLATKLPAPPVERVPEPSPFRATLPFGIADFKVYPLPDSYTDGLRAGQRYGMSFVAEEELRAGDMLYIRGNGNVIRADRLNPSTGIAARDYAPGDEVDDIIDGGHRRAAAYDYAPTRKQADVADQRIEAAFDAIRAAIESDDDNAFPTHYNARCAGPTAIEIRWDESDYEPTAFTSYHVVKYPGQ